MKKVMLEELEHERTPFPYSLQSREGRQGTPLSHIHPHCQITQNVRGVVAYNIDKKNLKLNQGDVILINANIPHGCTQDEEGLRRNLGFYPGMLELNVYNTAYKPLLNMLYSNAYPYMLLKKKECNEMGLTGILDDIFKIPENHYVAQDGLIHNRVVDLSIVMTQWVIQMERQDIQQISTVLYKSAEYIEENHKEPIRVGDAAGAAGLNPSYFSHCFKRKFGISFKQYLNRKRLEEAAVELTTTGKQIPEIAFSCGFGSLTTFYQNFTEFYRISPKKFRDLNIRI